MEASLRVVGLQSNLQSAGDISEHTEETNNTSEILGLFVKAKGFLKHALSFEVLSPPLIELRLSLALDECLKSIKVSSFTKHPWDLNFMSITQNEVSYGIVDLADALKMLCKSVLSIFKVDPVILFSNFNRLIPFSTGLVEFTEKIISATLTIKLLSIIDHVELDSDHGDSSLRFLLLLSFSGGLSSSSKSHVS
jgi:hypothetical protein